MTPKKETEPRENSPPVDSPIKPVEEVKKEIPPVDSPVKPVEEVKKEIEEPAAQV